MSTKINLTGQRFDHLVVIKEIPARPGKKETRWLCQCDCGNTCKTTTSSLRQGKRSCGCIRTWRKEIATKNVCPFPCEICRENVKGKCCRQCEEYNTCYNACLNTPDKCGFNGAGK